MLEHAFSSVSCVTEIAVSSRYLKLTQNQSELICQGHFYLFIYLFLKVMRNKVQMDQNAFLHLSEFLVICGIKSTYYPKMMTAFVLNVALYTNCIFYRWSIVLVSIPNIILRIIIILKALWNKLCP